MMISQQKQHNTQRDKRDTIILVLTILLIVLLTGLITVVFLRKTKELPAEAVKEPQTDTVVISVPSGRDTIEKIIEKVKVIVRIDTIIQPAETVCVETAAVEKVQLDPCAQDTIAPWVYPDPSGGLHYSTVRVHLIPSEPCRIEYRFKNEQKWLGYKAGDSIVLKSNAVLCYRATDSCGNAMVMRCEAYEISKPPVKRCPEGMEHIKVGDESFCIDRYEWPNKKGQKPFSFVSVYQAMDSCYTAGKRLCSSDEWSVACGGAYNWKYPYGDVYEPNACNSRDTAVGKSGGKPECRGYFGIYDMAGNLAEWTNTRSSKNKSYFNVMGGFWESGPQGSCFEPRYSYFPQNKHNPVGFRCCSDVNKE